MATGGKGSFLFDQQIAIGSDLHTASVQITFSGSGVQTGISSIGDADYLVARPTDEPGWAAFERVAPSDPPRAMEPKRYVFAERAPRHRNPNDPAHIAWLTRSGREQLRLHRAFETDLIAALGLGYLSPIAQRAFLDIAHRLAGEIAEDLILDSSPAALAKVIDAAAELVEFVRVIDGGSHARRDG